MSIGCPCWMAFTERTLKLRPSLVRSTWYSTGTFGSPKDPEDSCGKQLRTLTVASFIKSVIMKIQLKLIVKDILQLVL